MNRIFLIFVSLILSVGSLTAQTQQASGPKYTFTLEDVVQLAKEQSPNAIMARHRFRASYFSFMEYKANFLPKLTFSTNPTTYDHSIRTVQSADSDGNLKITEAKANTFTSTAGLDLSQNVGFTGGTISLGSNFSRIQNLDDDSDFGTQYTTSPIRLSFSQPLNGYNQYKWLKKIEPLRYQEAQQNYIVQMETVSSRAVDYFFALALAQVSLNMAKTNFTNSKTLYEISQGRYQNGIIAEDALLQMELRYMQAESKLNKAKIDIEAKQSQLRSFLGFKDNVEIILQIGFELPGLQVPYEKAVDHAMSQSPDIISYNRQILEAERTVAQTKSQKGITMSFDASFGLNKTGYEFQDAYKPAFDDREGVSIGIRVPILDWNQAKNSYRNAQSQLEVVQVQMQQNETDFKQNVYLQVMQFNMQENQVRIAAKADTIAQKGYDISYERYKIGKVSVTDLNIADSDKDAAKMSYMSELQSYWNYYYTVRRLTLFDFLNNRPLEEDFGKIVGD